MTRSRNRRLRLIPSHLPLIRDKLIAFQRFRTTRQYVTIPKYRQILDEMWNESDQMASAQLWWVSRDMARLAADTVAQGDFPRMQPPAASGVVFIEGGVPIDTSSDYIVPNA